MRYAGSIFQSWCEYFYSTRIFLSDIPSNPERKSRPVVADSPWKVTPVHSRRPCSPITWNRHSHFSFSLNYFLRSQIFYGATTAWVAEKRKADSVQSRGRLFQSASECDRARTQGQTLIKRQLARHIIRKLSLVVPILLSLPTSLYP